MKRKWWRGKAGALGGGGKSPKAAPKDRSPGAKWGGACLNPETGPPRRSLERRPRSARSLLAAAAPAAAVQVEVPPLPTAAPAAAGEAKAAQAGRAREEGTPRLSPRTPDGARGDDGVAMGASVRSSECGSELAAGGSTGAQQLPYDFYPAPAAGGAAQLPGSITPGSAAAVLAATAPGGDEAAQRAQRRPHATEVRMDVLCCTIPRPPRCEGSLACATAAEVASPALTQATDCKHDLHVCTSGVSLCPCSVKDCWEG